MSRKVLMAAAVASSLVALTACSGSGSDGGGGKTTISFAFWGNNDEAATLRAMVAAFQQAHPNITVQSNWIQGDYEQKLQTAIAGGEAPTVAEISDTSLPSFSRAFRPVDVDTSHYYSPAVAKAGNVGGTNYAVPFTAKGKVMAINTSLFTAANLPVPSSTTPMSPDDFVTYAKKLTKRSGTKVYGSAPLWYDGWLIAVGGSYFTPDGTKCAMGDAAGIRAAQIVADAAKPDGFTPTRAEAQGQDMGQWLADGRIAMMPDYGPWDIPKFAALDPTTFAIVPMPGKGEPMEVDALGIAKDATAAEAEAAKTFATFMSSDPAAQNLMASTRSALGVPVIQGSVDAFKAVAPKVNLQAFVDAVQNAVPTPHVKNYLAIASRNSNAWDTRTAIGSGHEDPAVVMPQVQADCQKMLDEANE
ncbi:extracellular solute-binding protein [Micromonospora sp. NPDC049559]|uniref:extracellular solute-binding protein n=1 Tax=Micromonospora sp. NPDC049559 TaxID=3155923 RepID=UPI00343AEBFD